MPASRTQRVQGGPFDRPLGRRGLLAVAVLQLSLYAVSWLVPYLGPWPIEPLDGLEEPVGAATTLLWLAATLVAISAASTVRLRKSMPERRFPTPVEATAYFAIAEALTNVVRYAGAAEARVTASVDGDRLVIGVEDDGAGGADPERGSGLRGLRDRVPAIGGSLAVTSPPGRGTLVQAELPLS